MYNLATARHPYSSARRTSTTRDHNTLLLLAPIYYKNNERVFTLARGDAREAELDEGEWRAFVLQ